MWIKFYYYNDKHFEEEFKKNREAFTDSQYSSLIEFIKALPQIKRSWELYLEVRLEKMLPEFVATWQLVASKFKSGKRNWSNIELFVMDYKERNVVCDILRKFFIDEKIGMGGKDEGGESEYKKEIGGDLEALGIVKKLLGDANTTLINKERNYYINLVERIEWLDTPKEFIGQCAHCKEDIRKPEKLYADNVGAPICYKCYKKGYSHEIKGDKK